MKEHECGKAFGQGECVDCDNEHRAELLQKLDILRAYAIQLRRTVNVAISRCTCVVGLSDGIPCSDCQMLDDAANEWPIRVMSMLRDDKHVP